MPAYKLQFLFLYSQLAWINVLLVQYLQFNVIYAKRLAIMYTANPILLYTLYPATAPFVNSDES
jgi:hypothetical protein